MSNFSKKEILENICDKMKNLEMEFGDFSYELQKIGFEGIEYNENDINEILKDGECYYSFVDKVGIGEENEELEGYKAKVIFEVLIWNGIDERLTASKIKIIECKLEK
ncbi:hypothetical protein [Clostridium perfringens]|uniref:hypothetical protein n=1 Tax=Clostridium perfringens TaxID=1502 RepID=UPI0032DA0A24